MENHLIQYLTISETFAEAVYESDHDSSYVSYPGLTQSVNVAAECVRFEKTQSSLALFV